MSYSHTGKDFYKILRVSPSASLTEIKTAYRKLVFELHPDRHRGTDEGERQRKTKQFKLITEAYSVLSDVSQKTQYDFNFGYRYNKNRKTAPPKNYGKVYAPCPPPNWKRVWDHKEHYDMHYGTGMQDEALKSARKSAQKEGAFEYQSPLGKGFTFSRDDPGDHFNPYSKHAPQGPPRVTFEYEEVYKSMDINNKGREHLNRRDRVVEDLYGRRQERTRRQHHAEYVRRNQQQVRYNATFATNDNECIIL